MIIGISGKIGSGKDTIGKIIQGLELGEDTFVGGIIGFLESYEDYNASQYPTHWQIKRFADKLKDIVCILLGCTREQLEDREFKEKELGEEWWVFKFPNNQISTYKKDVPNFWQKYLIKLTPRFLLQLLGTECGRQIIHPNVWVNSLFADYKTYRKTKSFTNPTLKDEELPNWIITDVRFPNEAEAIKDRDGIVIRINRPTKEDLEYKELCDKYGKQAPVVTDWLNKNKYKFTRQHESETALDDYQDWDYIIQNDGTIEDLVEKVKDIMVKRNLL